MSSKGRWTLMLGSLLAVSALGTWGCCTVTCCDNKPRNQLVLVSDLDADWEKIKEIVIKKSLYQEIVWKLASQSTVARVEITPRAPATDTKPFENCQMTENVCWIVCKDGLCPSGAIALNVVRPVYYDYTFKRNTGQASSDPGIRIDP